MKDYLILITSIIVFLAIFEGVLPKGKYGQIVKTVVSMVVVLVILNPIVNIYNSSYNFDTLLSENSEYQEYLNEYKKATLENEIKSLLTIEGYEVLSVSVTSDDSENKVEILIKKDELKSEEEHIDILVKAKNLIVERFYLTSWEIIVA